MTDPSNGQEPSMEDILASIRRIIDEDDRKAAGPAVTPRLAPEGDDEDVLELTDTVEDDIEDESAERDSGPEGWDTDAGVLPQESIDMGYDAEAFEPAEPENFAPAAPPMSPLSAAADEPTTTGSQESTMTTSNNDRLVSDAALSSAAAALGSLARASERDPLGGVPQGRPVEDLVMELLRPMLREWLDEHLPTIVERIVEREVRYLSRRMGGDDGA
ncbi:MAG: DUF2497 domain-containing protein [Proteobacteria bacterium]|nr:DUF2497 domain-containing protein [Pseudomonadota bacterium]